MPLCKTFSDENKSAFKISDWRLAVPKVIPLQYTSCDRGVYYCMHVEILTTGKDTVLQYHINKDLFTYRSQIKDIMPTSIRHIWKKPSNLTTLKRSASPVQCRSSPGRKHCKTICLPKTLKTCEQMYKNFKSNE